MVFDLFLEFENINQLKWHKKKTNTREIRKINRKEILYLRIEIHFIMINKTKKSINYFLDLLSMFKEY